MALKSPPRKPSMRGCGIKLMEANEDMRLLLGKTKSLVLRPQVESEDLMKQSEEIRKRLRVWTTALIPENICKEIILQSENVGYQRSNHGEYGTAVLSLRTNGNGKSNSSCTELRKNKFLWDTLCTIHCQTIAIIKEVYGDTMECQPLVWRNLTVENYLEEQVSSVTSNKRSSRGAGRSIDVSIASPVRKKKKGDTVLSIDEQRRSKAEAYVDNLKQNAVKDAANDMFLARYHPEMCPGLELHRDGTWVSYVLHLGGDGHSGCTRFPNILETPRICHNVGDVSVHNGQALHGADDVVGGYRYVFVGFVRLADGNPQPEVSDSYDSGLSGDIYASGEQLDAAAINAKCCVCDSEDDPNNMLLCDECNERGATHIYCCRPKLKKIPLEKENWFCASCSQKYKKRSLDSYGKEAGKGKL